MRRALRGARRAAYLTASAARVTYARLAFPGVAITGSTLGPGCEIYAGAGAEIVLSDVVVGRGCQIIAGPGASVRIAAESIGPHSTIVARDRIEIEEGTLLAEMVVVRDADHARAGGLPLRAGLHEASPVHIGPDVWLGARSTVLRGVHIGAGATVGAGAVVTRDVPPGTTAAGVPATTLRTHPLSGESS
ncbi:MAG TPA: DapH/DapD/GlmU-related protein [Amycolatopsis sp.]|nr:DapH/DapD/GlmU-related protein [Amycolatopsis sp.]